MASVFIRHLRFRGVDTFETQRWETLAPSPSRDQETAPIGEVEAVEGEEEVRDESAVECLPTAVRLARAKQNVPQCHRRCRQRFPAAGYWAIRTTESVAYGGDGAENGAGHGEDAVGQLHARSRLRWERNFLLHGRCNRTEVAR